MSFGAKVEKAGEGKEKLKGHGPRSGQEAVIVLIPQGQGYVISVCMSWRHLYRLSCHDCMGMGGHEVALHVVGVDDI
ncbi:hypothetical protein MRB53_006456 [Persea americana]|uniref:Uncharacterized protein n=1 Tax=Persea americana TaxID=3435 RepID=A0ACC2MGG7_PERAE|nr:hypothetical protein MRB53_006456 [Persea americana]